MSAPTTEKVSPEANKAHVDHIDDHPGTIPGDNKAGTIGTSGGIRTPEMDFEKAASFKPSKLHGKGLGFMITFVAGTGFTLFGYDQGVLSGLMTLVPFMKQFPQAAVPWGNDSLEMYGMTPHANAATLQSFMVAIYELGCMAGALSNIWLGDRLGRRRTIALGGLIMTIGAIIQCAAVDYAMMLVSRVITGIGNGLLTSTVPAYQSECAKPHQRGPLVLFSGSLITFGIMISYWINLGFYFVAPNDHFTGPNPQGGSSASWRFPIAFQIFFALVMVGCLYGFRLPESPRWLVAKGRHEEALAVLAALSSTSVDDPEVRQTHRAIMDAVSQERFSFKQIFTGGRSQNFRRTIVGCLSQMFQQISGINLVTYYLTSVLVKMGMGPVMARAIAGVNGTCYFLTSLAALPMVERFGRRSLMIWTALLQALTFAILAGLYNITTFDANKVAQGFSVLMLFLFNTWFSVGWLGMTWLYPAEITPLSIRAPANALSTATNWLFNFMVVMCTGPMFENIGWGTYAFFAACNFVIILPVVIFFFPETKGRSLEEIDLVFAYAYEHKRSPVRVSTEKGLLPKGGSREAEIILGRLHEEKAQHGEAGGEVA